MNLQVGVKILLKNHEDKYLVLLRSMEKYQDIGQRWDIPGGRIDIGVSLFENLKREVLEETSLVLKEEPVLCGAQDILNPDKHVVRLTYRGNATGEVVLSDEHTEFKWLTLEELKELHNFDPYAKDIIETRIK